MQLLNKAKSVLTGKTAIKIFAILLVFCTFLQIPAELMTANAVTQSEIDELETKRDNLRARKADLESKIEALEIQQKSNVEKKQLLDEKLEVTQKEIESTNALIAQYVKYIADKKVEIKELEKKEEEQFNLYTDRVRTMEEKGNVSYYSILFGASSFSDLLARIDFIDEIMKYDETLYNQVIKAREATEDAKKELEATKAQHDATKAELVVLKEDLDKQLAEVAEVIAAIESDIASYESLVDAAEAEEASVQAQINKKNAELKAQLEAEAAANQNNNSGGSDPSVAENQTPVYSGNGTFIWPTASKLVTSPYGMRKHPILGYNRMHSGIDIGGGAGNTVKAAAAGTVITSTYASGYGNYVVVSHGNATTLYAHMSTRHVSVGDKVSQGQSVGLVGSTGLSTGPHLHFEISVNGSRIDPLSQYSSGQYTRYW